jgi:HlyD family secretion protein
MVTAPQGDRTDGLLSILSKGDWCLDVLDAVAWQRSCSKAELAHLATQRRATKASHPGDSKPLTDAILDKCLKLLRMAALIEQAGETITITARGVASAARLTPTAPANSDKAPGDPILEPPKQAQKALPPTENPVSVAADRQQGLDVSPRSEAADFPSHRVGAQTDGNNARHHWAANVVERKYIKLLLAAVAVFVVIGWNYVGAYGPGDGTRYRFTAVQQGDLTVSTVATGQLEALDTVEVSSQLSGQVVKLFADFNDKVAFGAPLAQLDDESYKAAVAQAEAQLAHAEASHKSAIAKIAGADARNTAAKETFHRQEILNKRGSVSTQALEKARANKITAESELNAAHADEAVQSAAIKQAKAALRKAQIDLDRTVIKSPITGTVIKRTVELGQTVAVSMKAPTLFTIARDLHHMRVHARVDEADIGRIREGQKVTFYVDAYPNRRFDGQVVEIHRAPKIVQNVVTYTVVINAENRDLVLLPGMTAIVHIITTERPNALLVPNAAFRFTPDSKIERSPDQDNIAASRRRTSRQLWIRGASGNLQRILVNVGKSDGSVTEVTSGNLSKGQMVAVGRQLVPNQRTLFGISLGH